MILITICWLLISSLVIFGQPSSKIILSDTLFYLNIPERSVDAIEGTDFVNQVIGLSIRDREKAIAKEILSGNVPSFSRKLKPLTIIQIINSKSYELVFFTVCDYMAVGSDHDYLYIPMTPSTAQYLADNMDCSLPTKRIVDIIYNKAEIKLKPQPIPPSDKMTTVPVFRQHTDSIKKQLTQIGLDRSTDNIIAGHKKDIIISNKIYSTDRDYERVVIYGWHLSKNNPIQPVYSGHIAMYADYSHGVRLIAKLAFLNGDSIQVDDILRDPNLSALLSSEGVIRKPYYPGSKYLTMVESPNKYSQIDFQLYQNYPNPFNPATTIKYSIPSIKTLHAASLQLKVYDVLGKEVAVLVSENKSAGSYEIKFDVSSLTSGVYYYQLKSGNFIKTKKMIVVK